MISTNESSSGVSRSLFQRADDSRVNLGRFNFKNTTPPWGNWSRSEGARATPRPAATFKSTGAKIEDHIIHVTGDFTMHGVTKRVVLPVTVLGTGTNPWMKKAQVGMAARTVLSRSEFGVNSWTDVAGILGDEVEVNLMVQANAQ